MKRINPEDVAKAFKETGLKPKQGAFFSSDNCACGLGVLYAREELESGSNLVSIMADVTGDPESLESKIAMQMHQKYGSHYCVGFANGFDIQDEEIRAYGKSSQISSDCYNAGFEDGKEAFQLVSSEVK